MNIIISAHGGRWSDQAKDLQVAKTSKVVYYVADGQLLSNSDGYAILDELEHGHEPGGVVNEQVSGAATYDYSCWYAPEFSAACGIFEVGTGKLLKDLSSYTEKQPLLLSQILAWYPNCTIYWLCCREISVRSATPYLQNSEGAHPSRPGWKHALHEAIDAFCDTLR